MKANNGSGDNEERDIWQTPKNLFDKLHNQYDFSIDCCASVENAKCWQFYEEFEKEEEKIEEINICWMNPPFSKSIEMFNHFFKVVSKGVAIYRCDNMETKVWQDIILKNADWIFIPKGRIRYEGMQGNGSRFPSALIGFRVEPPKNIEGKTLSLN